MATLGEVFKSFCAFGAGKDGKPPTMDNSKFAKLFRDLKLLDKKLTSTDVDIVFNKVKAPTERKISFKQFQEALKQLAEKKYPGDAEAYDKLKAAILAGKGPVTHSAAAKGPGGAAASTVDRLTDTSKYTGSHKERFDGSGKGKGVAGRKELPDGSGYVTGYKNADTFEEKKE